MAKPKKNLVVFLFLEAVNTMQIFGIAYLAVAAMENYPAARFQIVLVLALSAVVFTTKYLSGRY